MRSSPSIVPPGSEHDGEVYIRLSVNTFPSGLGLGGVQLEIAP